jgi:4-hydroxy-3-methylbut-2-en-1-yl diphosphate reductase
MSEAELLIAAPLRIEALLVRLGAPRAAVTVTGMGEGRARASAARLRATPASGLLVLGFCGALTEGPRPGELIVADELVALDREGGTEGVPRACPSASAIADLLAAHGLCAHVGRLVSSPRLTRGAERARLAETGAIAVDMESAWLAQGAAERPLGVVRAVVDTPARELARPLATLAGGVRAAISLCKAGRVFGAGNVHTVLGYSTGHGAQQAR